MLPDVVSIDEVRIQVNQPGQFLAQRFAINAVEMAVLR
jgi:hypothetical protein